MKKKRNRYTKEFKEAAVKLVTEQGYQISEAARNLGVNANLLGRWKSEMAEGQDGLGNKKVLQSELSRLRRENKRLQMERETKRMVTFIHQITVEQPVARLPPFRSLRADFPHRALQSYSLRTLK